jgi:hypothetical protein
VAFALSALVGTAVKLVVYRRASSRG